MKNVEQNLKNLDLGKKSQTFCKNSHGNTLICQKCFNVMDSATDGKPENILPLFKDNDMLKAELRYAIQHFINNTIICQRMVSMMIKLIKAYNNAAQWSIAEETQERIKAISMDHSNVVVVESECSLLFFLVKYNSDKERKV